MLETSEIRELGVRMPLPAPVHLNSARIVAEGVFRPAITSKELSEDFTETVGLDSKEFPLSTRIFEFDLRESDDVIVRTVETGRPLIVRRDGELIVNFDIRATQAFQFVDSKRPIYTYIPGFNIHKIPAGIRRPISNFVHSLRSPRRGDVVSEYAKLPLTSFEVVVWLLNKVLAGGAGCEASAFQWPLGKRAVFISLHDVDTGGLLRRRERDTLLRVEEKHRIKATWFAPTAHLKRKEVVDFLLQSGHEVGWHDHSHDHRLPFKPFADQRVDILNRSFLAEIESYPVGMRTPRLLKSNYLYEVLDRACPALRYDTSFLRGIVPYRLWLNGSESRILEIPTTVPTDILVYNKLNGLSRARKFETVLQAQIARTKKLIEVGGVISIVTHPEKDLSERPELLDVYDQYLSYIKSCPNIWFTTAGELFKFWTGSGSHLSAGSQRFDTPKRESMNP